MLAQSYIAFIIRVFTIIMETKKNHRVCIHSCTVIPPIIPVEFIVLKIS